jgi:hypothetical protein
MWQQYGSLGSGQYSKLAIGWTTGRLWLDFSAPRPVLGPTQPPMQWVTRAVNDLHASPYSADGKYTWGYNSALPYISAARVLN